MTTRKAEEVKEGPVEVLAKRVGKLEAEVKKLRAEKAMMRGE